MADDVVDKEIVDLPKATGVTGDTVFPGYVPGALNPAQKITAEQLKTFFGQEIAVVTYGDALADVEYQHATGKFLILKGGGYFALLCEATSSAFVFRTTVNMIGVNRRSLYEYTLDRSSGEWDSGAVYPEYAYNKVNTIDSSSTVMQYPSAKAVYDLAQSLVIEGGGGEGLPGSDGEDGGYYIPNISQPDQYTMQVDFTASKDNMAQAPTSYINLPPGPKGTPGEPGQPGSPGSPGMDGEDGKSAYEYAQDGGYTGTEAEFAKKLAAGQPDWNQNDDTAADYIKHRPFYVKSEVVAEEQTVTAEDQGDAVAGKLTLTGELEVGKTYIVEFDGTSYRCTAYHPVETWGEHNFPTVTDDILLGDIRRTGDWYLELEGLENGEPFAIIYSGSSWLMTDSVGTHTIKVTLDGDVIVNERYRNALNVQPDWEQNDETAADYIKNKPITSKESIAVEEQTVTTEDTGEGILSALSSTGVLEAGKNYVVTLNGIVYECVAESMNPENFPDGGIALGNGTLLDSQMPGHGITPTDDPFAIVYVEYDSSFMLATRQAGTYTVKVDWHDVKLDFKYLDMNAIKAALPTVELVATLEDGTTKIIRMFGEAVTE